MSTGFPSRIASGTGVLAREIEEMSNLGPADHVQKLAFLVPSYTTVSATFLYNFSQLLAHYAHRTGWYPPFQFQTGAYVDQNMRQGVKQLLNEPDWERLLVVEIDMICPSDSFIRHALHTDDIVGSIYFQHRPPFQCNIMGKSEETKKISDNLVAHYTPEGIAKFLREPGLYRCDSVGLGLTSISRHVFEDWDSAIPTFLTRYEDTPIAQETTTGALSHDVHFCLEAGKQGFEVWFDSSIVCKHLTEGIVDERNFAFSHPEAFTSKIVRPKVPHLVTIGEESVSKSLDGAAHKSRRST